MGDRTPNYSDRPFSSKTQLNAIALTPPFAIALSTKIHENAFAEGMAFAKPLEEKPNALTPSLAIALPHPLLIALTSTNALTKPS